MKKTIFGVMFAIAATMFMGSCTGSTKTGSDVDSTAVDTVLVDTVAVDSVAVVDTLCCE